MSTWEAYTTDDGAVYYCNHATGVTQWDKPADFDAVTSVDNIEVGECATGGVVSQNDTENDLIAAPHTNSNIMFKIKTWSKTWDPTLPEVVGSIKCPTKRFNELDRKWRISCILGSIFLLLLIIIVAASAGGNNMDPNQKELGVLLSNSGTVSGSSISTGNVNPSVSAMISATTSSGSNVKLSYTSEDLNPNITALFSEFGPNARPYIKKDYFSSLPSVSLQSCNFIYLLSFPP